MFDSNTCKGRILRSVQKFICSAHRVISNGLRWKFSDDLDTVIYTVQFTISSEKDHTRYDYTSCGFIQSGNGAQVPNPGGAKAAQ